MFYTVPGSDSTQSGGTTTTTTINVVVPVLGVLYDFFVVAYSDAANTLPSEPSNNSTTGIGQFVCSNIFLMLLVTINLVQRVTNISQLMMYLLVHQLHVNVY